MSSSLHRRDFLSLAGACGVVFASGLPGCGRASAGEDFFFLQLSDTHWGYSGAANPEADVTLKKAIAAIRSSGDRPDFVVLTGDLIHTTDDPGVRRARMTELKRMVSELGDGALRFLPGEHDAALDRGEAYKEIFGPLHGSFDHKGIHFVMLDNASDPTGSLGDAQIEWLRADLAKLDRAAPVVVFSHRPLFDLYPDWEWATRDGAAAIEALERQDHVTAFYGHIHQEHHHTTGRIEHHAARSLVFPLPAPGAAPKRAPLPWDPAHPGIGYRRVAPGARGAAARLTELPVTSA
jgi:hypothetical protein